MYRDEDQVNEAKIEAKTRLENFCVTVRNASTEEELENVFEAGDNEQPVHDALIQVDKIPSAVKDVVEAGRMENVAQHDSGRWDKHRSAENDDFAQQAVVRQPSSSKQEQ